jgi:CheY-like chemotaxis protein
LLVQKKEGEYTDYMMPGMDGIEATAAIRDWEKNISRPAVPIIALVANVIIGMKEMFWKSILTITFQNLLR